MKNKDLKIQLRELRNKIIYNGDVPLSVGCEFDYQSKHWEARQNDIYCLDDGETEDVMLDYLVEMAESDKFASTPIILGKPVTLQEILFILNHNKKYNVSLGGAPSQEPYLYIIETLSEKDVIKFDLTRTPEEQDGEVLEKLLEIIR